MDKQELYVNIWFGSFINKTELNSNIG